MLMVTAGTLRVATTDSRPSRVANWTSSDKFQVKLDIPPNRFFAGLGVRRQDFQNFSPLVFVRVGVVNQRICVGDKLDHVLTTGTADPNPGMKREGPKLLEVESKRIDTMRTVEDATVIVMEHPAR